MTPSQQALTPRLSTTLDTVQEILGALVARYRTEEVLTSVRHIPAREAPGQVPDAEETAHINRATLENIAPVDVRQTARSQVEPGAGDDAALDCDIFDVMILEISRRFDLDQTPAAVPAAVEHVHPHEHAAMFERGFKDGRDLRVCQKLAGRADRLLMVSRLDFHAARKKLMGSLPT